MELNLGGICCAGRWKTCYTMVEYPWNRLISCGFQASGLFGRKLDDEIYLTGDTQHFVQKCQAFFYRTEGKIVVRGNLLVLAAGKNFLKHLLVSLCKIVLLEIVAYVFLFRFLKNVVVYPAEKMPYYEPHGEKRRNAHCQFHHGPAKQIREVPESEELEHKTCCIDKRKHHNLLYPVGIEETDLLSKEVSAYEDEETQGRVTVPHGHEGKYEYPYHVNPKVKGEPDLMDKGSCHKNHEWNKEPAVKGPVFIGQRKR